MWLIDYFKEDPLRLLTVIGGSGGDIYWWDRIKNRLRVKLRLIEIKQHSVGGNLPSIVFEAENLGDTSTSIEPFIVLKGYIPPKMKKVKTRRFKQSLYVYQIDSQQRHLPPRTPIKFTAICISEDDERSFLQLGVYIFKPTVGRRQKVRVKSIGGPETTIIKFWFLKAVYLISSDLFVKKFVG